MMAMPVLAFADSGADRIVDVEHANRLYDKAKGDKRLWIVPGGDHTSAFSFFRETYAPMLVDYLEKRLPPK